MAEDLCEGRVGHWGRSRGRSDTGMVPSHHVGLLRVKSMTGGWGVMGGELDGGLRAHEENFTLHVHFITNWSLFICSEAEPH